MVFDIQIAYNQKWMNTTATFIRDKIEKFFQDTYHVQLYESQALDFNAYASRLVEIGVTLFVSTFCISRLIQAEIFYGIKIFTVIGLILLCVYSSYCLIDSVRGHKFL